MNCKRKRWDVQDTIKLTDFRNYGKTKLEFETEFGRPWTSISKQMSKLKIAYWGNKEESSYIVKKNTLEICNRYKKGEKISSIRKDFSVSKYTILRYLRMNNIPVRPDQFTHSKKYKINQNYFDSINSEDKAYFLGLLFADGCNNPQEHSIRIELQSRDKHILYEFRKKLQSTIPITFQNKKRRNSKAQNAYRLDMYNKHMSYQLENLGMMKNKHFKCDFPDIPAWLHVHFIRGYFDGDGSVFSGIKKLTHTPKFSFNITGNKLIVEKIQDILIENLGLTRIKLQTRYKEKGNSTRAFCYNGNLQCIKIRNWLYKDATIYLKRKFNKFSSIPTEKRNRKGEQSPLSRLKSDQVLEIRKLHKEGVIQRVIAEMFGIKIPTVQSIVYKQNWKHI